MTKYLLVRHGETMWNSSRVYQGQQDIELSENGIRQAECLAERLARERIHAIYASDLKRAYLTAAIAAKPHALSVVVDSRLREMGWGFFEGMNHADAVARYPDEWQRWNSDWVNNPPPGASETLMQMAARVQVFFAEADAAHPDQTVLVVAHAGPLRAMLCRVMHIDPAYFWQYRVDNASITVMDTYGDRAIVSLLNDVCHLGGLTV